LATPFIEIHQVDFGLRPSLIRWAVLLAMLPLLRLVTVWLFPSALSDVPISPINLSLSAELIFQTVVGLPILAIGYFYWIRKKRTAARQNQVDALSCATRLAVAPQRMLVVRAIDDEASLILALGATLNYVTVKSIMFVNFIIGTLVFTALPAWFFFKLVAQRSPDHYPSWYQDVVGLWGSVITIMLFCVLAI